MLLDIYCLIALLVGFRIISFLFLLRRAYKEQWLEDFLNLLRSSGTRMDFWQWRLLKLCWVFVLDKSIFVVLGGAVMVVNVLLVSFTLRVLHLRVLHLYFLSLVLYEVHGEVHGVIQWEFPSQRCIFYFFYIHRFSLVSSGFSFFSSRGQGSKSF